MAVFPHDEEGDSPETRLFMSVMKGRLGSIIAAGIVLLLLILSGLIGMIVSAVSSGAS